MTACAPADRLKQTVLVHVPGLTDNMFSLELWNVIDEFFRRTSAWRYATDITLNTESQEYDLGLPADSVLVRMMGVSLNGTPVPSAAQTGVTQSSFGVLHPELSFPDGDAQFDPTESDLVAGAFTYAVYRPDYISLTSFPTSEQTEHPLKAIAALSVAPRCMECDCGDWLLEDWMWDMFFQDWYDGVLARLYGMPSKPWTSPTLAVYHGKRFRQALAYRKQEANRGFVYGVPGFRFPKVGGWV